MATNSLRTNRLFLKPVLVLKSRCKNLTCRTKPTKSRQFFGSLAKPASISRNNVNNFRLGTHVVPQAAPGLNAMDRMKFPLAIRVCH